MTIPAFPKIFHVGDRYTTRLFDGPVEITEKVDGSQFVFGKDEAGKLLIRSKGKVMYLEAPEQMFQEAVDYVQSIESILPRGVFYYSEYLKKPKHNTLAYSTTPKHHLALFGVSFGTTTFINVHADLCAHAAMLDIDVVPCLHSGEVDKESLHDSLLSLLDTDSYLGGTKIEGVVVKNYAQDALTGRCIIPVLMGKFVSEAFKEKHQKTWTAENTARGGWAAFCESHRSEARWTKAVQHTRDNGNLLLEPKDIGGLIKEIQRDIIEEEKDCIKDYLWKEFGQELLRKSIAGFPEWYKEQLVKGTFAG